MSVDACILMMFPGDFMQDFIRLIFQFIHLALAQLCTEV